MADTKTAADRLNELLDRAPKEADYVKSRTTGSGKNVRTVQTLDRAAFDVATQKFQDNYGSAIKALQAQLGQETTQGALATEAAKARADYLQGPTHALFSDFAAAPPLAGTLGGYGLARMTTPKALPGASPVSRALLMAGPLAEAALGPVVDTVARRAQGENPTARGQDVTGAVGNFGLGESAGAVAGGLYQAMGGMGRNVKSMPGAAPSPAAPLLPEPPPVEPPLNLTGMNTKKAAEAIVGKLGATPAPTLPENRAIITAAYPNASPEVKAALAASHANLKTPGAMNKALNSQWNKKWALPLAILGGAAAGDALSPTDASASEGPARDESLTAYRLRQALNAANRLTGTFTPEFRPDIWPEMAAGASELGASARGVLTGRPSPVVNTPPRSTRDLSADVRPAAPDTGLTGEFLAPDTRRRQLETARSEDARQRGLGIGDEAARAAPANGGVSDYRDVGTGGPGRPSAYVPSSKMGFSPDDLPDYERGLLEKGISPAEAAMHLMPHARAGAEAVKRGEDFWGGSDQFERERAALQAFYNLTPKSAGASNAAAPAPGTESNRVPPASMPPSSDDGDTLSYARGGKVHAQRILKLYN